ncbi:hypothetical protein [Lysobacter gummosus]
MVGSERYGSAAVATTMAGDGGPLRIRNNHAASDSAPRQRL